MSAPASAACPRCGAFAPMLPIVYGYASFELFEASRLGEIALGGCVIRRDHPTHRCTACGEDVIPIAESNELMADVCATCSRPLGGDPEDERAGDAGLPICGECNRSRNFDAIDEAELLDGAE